MHLEKDAGAMLKLNTDVVPFKFKLREKFDEGNEDNPFPVTGTIDLFLRRLTPREEQYMKAQGNLTYMYWFKENGDKEAAAQATKNVMSDFKVLFSLRKGDKPDSERFFTSEADIVDYPHTGDKLEIVDAYNTAFCLTSEEWGNSLRARLCLTSRDLPVTTQEQPLLDPISQS